MRCIDVGQSLDFEIRDNWLIRELVTDSTGERVGWTKWGETMERDYGSPYYHIHRADFHNLLYDLAKPVSTIRLSSTVVALDPSPTRPSVTSKNG